MTCTKISYGKVRPMNFRAGNLDQGLSAGAASRISFFPLDGRFMSEFFHSNRKPAKFATGSGLKKVRFALSRNVEWQKIVLQLELLT